ncbi:MAG: ABC transporter ATP-binding protein [Syntrophomonas sp.]
MAETEQTALMTVTGLSQKRGRREVIKNLSFTLLKNECLGIFGLRGSGKTTLLHTLAGIDRVSSGKVEILGHDIKKSTGFKKSLGLVTQEPSLFKDLKVLENLDYIAVLKGCGPRNITPLVERLELGEFLQKPVTNLDLGVYQRLSLACALVNDPEILIADELIRDIDLYSHHLIIREMERFLGSGRSCIWGFSNIEDAERMSRIVWLEAGLNEIYEPEAALAKWDEIKKANFD